MLVSSTDEFQAFMFEQLHFLPEVNGNYTCYSDREHPESGYCCIYCREGYYQLGIADYTIPEDFSVSFRNPVEAASVWDDAFRGKRILSFIKRMRLLLHLLLLLCWRKISKASRHGAPETIFTDWN